jgi:energy-coupling factor transporter ATP-binding protein EcfA2
MKTMDLRHKAKHILITGRSGSGKTTLAEQIIRAESKQDLVFIFDPEFEFSGRFGDDAKVCVELDEMGTGEDYQIFIYTPPTDADTQTEFDDFCFFCFNFTINFEGGVLMVIDELQEYVNPDNYPEDFKRCITRGRRYRLDMLYISAAPNLLHNAIRTQTSEAIAFAQSDELPIRFNKTLGFDAEAILALNDLEYLRKQIGHPPKSGEIKFDKRR